MPGLYATTYLPILENLNLLNASKYQRSNTSLLKVCRMI